MRTDNRDRLNATLWILQVLLAALYLFAGTMKLMMPAAVLAQQIPLPVWFMRFVATAEVLGAAGLLLPGLVRIHTALTPLAASGLVVIMIGATTITISTAGLAMAMFPLVAGLLAVCVAYGRWRLAPMARRANGCPSRRNTTGGLRRFVMAR